MSIHLGPVGEAVGRRIAVFIDVRIFVVRFGSQVELLEIGQTVVVEVAFRIVHVLVESIGVLVGVGHAVPVGVGQGREVVTGRVGLGESLVVDDQFVDLADELDGSTSARGRDAEAEDAAVGVLVAGIAGRGGGGEGLPSRGGAPVDVESAHALGTDMPLLDHHDVMPLAVGHALGADLAEVGGAHAELSTVGDVAPVKVTVAGALVSEDGRVGPGIVACAGLGGLDPVLDGGGLVDRGRAEVGQFRDLTEVDVLAGVGVGVRAGELDGGSEAGIAGDDVGVGDADPVDAVKGVSGRAFVGHRIKHIGGLEAPPVSRAVGGDLADPVGVNGKGGREAGAGDQEEAKPAFGSGSETHSIGGCLKTHCRKFPGIRQ